MQYLIIKVKALESEVLDYAVLENETATAHFSSGTWDIVKKKSRSKKVIVTIPTEQVFLDSVSIPSRNKKQLKQAVPFALEDRLAEELDHLHFVLHSTSADKKTWVAVINRALLQQWVHLLRKKKLFGSSILPDVFLLPYTKKSWTLSIQAERALLRTGLLAGFSCSIDILPIVLKNYFNNKQNTEAIEHLVSYTDTTLTLDIPDECQLEIQPSDDRVAAKSVLAGLALNLKQGMNQEEGITKHINWRCWRTTGLLISLCLITYLAFVGIQNQFLEKKNQGLQIQAKKIFLQTFPKRRTVVNPRIEMQAELKKLRKSSGKVDSMYLEIMHQLGQLLSKDKQIRIKSIRYRDHQLSANLLGKKVSQLEDLKINMQAASAMYQVELRSISSSNRQVSATLIVKEK
jgi:type II secretion system protein L